MKKLFKILSLILTISIIFTSCGKITPESVTDKITEHLEKGDYNSAKAYISEIDNDTKIAASESSLKAIANEFDKIYKTYENNDVFDITKFNKKFIEKCVKLWSVASEFTPDDELNYNESLIYLRYFSSVSEVLPYSEMTRMLSDMNSKGYFYAVQKSLNDYENLGEYSYFENAREIISSFDSSEYNPHDHYIAELREANDKMNKYYISVNNGFATNDTSVIASSINNIYEQADVLLYACNTAENVHSYLTDAMNTFRLNGISAEFNKEIDVPSSVKYSSDTEFPCSYITGEKYSPSGQDNSDNKNDGTGTLSKAEAISVTVNAINKTKSYKSAVTVSKTQNINIQMTAFTVESEFASAISIVRVQINDALQKSNGTSKDTKQFSGGVGEDGTLNEYIPPSGIPANLDPSLVENYTAVKGSGGYVITLELKPCTSTDGSKSNSINSIVDGFYFDKSSNGTTTKTFYGPTSISLTVNNSGNLLKYDYSVSGVSESKFTEKGTEVATGEFSFKQEYSYNFQY